MQVNAHGLRSVVENINITMSLKNQVSFLIYTAIKIVMSSSPPPQGRQCEEFSSNTMSYPPLHRVGHQLLQNSNVAQQVRTGEQNNHIQLRLQRKFKETQCNNDDYIHIWIEEYELHVLSPNFLVRAFCDKLYNVYSLLRPCVEIK